MTAFQTSLRPLMLGALVVALATGGCAWTRNKLGMDAKYSESGINQPLEVPPGLDAPNTAGAVTIPDVTPNPNLPNPTGGVPVAGTGVLMGVDAFVLNDTLDSAYRRIGIALPKIEGVEMGDSAQVLNSYEVTYKGVTTLVRAQNDGSGSTSVVALGPDGQPLRTGPATELLARLKYRLNN